MNKDNILRQVIKAIETYPTDIKLKRVESIDDGIGGYEPNIITVAEFKGFLDESGNSLSILNSTSDRGKVTRIKKITLIAPCSNDYKIKIGDYFEADDKTYEVIYPSAIFDICYLCELEVVI